MSTTTTDTTTDTRRGYTVVYSSDNTPASGVFDSEAAARAWLDSCPDSWNRERFEVVECDPLPLPPVVPWAQRVTVDGPPIVEADTYTCEATLPILDRPHMPSVLVEALYELRDGQWHTYQGPDVVVTVLSKDARISSDDARTMAAALVEAADKLAQITAGGGRE